jgi:hypothetical protein
MYMETFHLSLLSLLISLGGCIDLKVGRLTLPLPLEERRLFSSSSLRIETEFILLGFPPLSIRRYFLLQIYLVQRIKDQGSVMRNLFLAVSNLDPPGILFILTGQGNDHRSSLRYYYLR